MSINRVMISGNLTRDPELRSLPSGSAVLSFGVAVNDRRQNQQTGEWEDYPNFVDCTIFGNRAQGLSNVLTKGMKVALEGRLRYSSWESNGQRRSKLEVIADNVDIMSTRGQGGGQYQGNQYQGGQGGYQQAPQNSYAQQPQVQAPQNSYAAPAPAAPAQPVQQAPVAAAPSQMPPSRDVYDEDIPF